MSKTEGRVVITESGRSGHIDYVEADQVVRFDWEFGGGKVVAIIRLAGAGDWDSTYLWARGRKMEIMQRVAQEAIRQKAPMCSATYNEAATMIQIEMA